MQKRILVIGLTERMGGVETFIFNTTRFSDKSKYEYDYLVHGANHCVFEQEIDDFYVGEQHLFFVSKYKDKPFKCLKELIGFYRRHGSKYDYIHLQTGSTAEVFYAFPFCIFFGIKVISHSHNGNGYSTTINRIFRPIVNLISSKRLACSTFAADWLFGKKYGKGAIIINNGIDTKRFEFNNEARRKIRDKFLIDDNLIIGHIGRFSEQKNHKFIVKIFNEILKKVPNAKLMLVGVGELENAVKELCINLDIMDSVIFCGSHNNIEEYYCAFDVFLMPSLYEGLPIVGIEAQSEGLQCFFSSNISEQIKITDKSIIMSLQKSEKEWADAILEKLISKDRYIYAKRVANAGYSIEATVRELEKVYEV